MYRYNVDNAVTYTSEDFVLFRESPFACWMERLTLENPDHGIPPDVGSQPPQSSQERQDDIVDTLRAEGRDVTLVDWELEESKRRSATLEAMRAGADFIVNGQLALGPLSGSVNLLMRTSGYSELGDFLYIPCDTQAKTTLHSAFRLCFLGDLLHSLQGQLPPQMLIIRGGSDVVPLQTEDHIYHYRAVKQRFMAAMRDFRKHRMPNPAESSHFGRWSDCANEVLKQRALRGEEPDEQLLDEELQAPLLQVANASLQADARLEPDDSGLEDQIAPGQTLAEQAQMLTPGRYSAGANGVRPGSTPNLERARQQMPAGDRAAAAGPAQAPLDEAGHRHETPGSDVALENLEFIGSSHRAPLIGVQHEQPEPEERPKVCDAPAPTLGAPLEAASRDLETGDLETGECSPGDPPDAALREPTRPSTSIDRDFEALVPAEQAGFSPEAPRAPVAAAFSTVAPPNGSRPPRAPAKPLKSHPLDSVGFDGEPEPAVDMDAASVTPSKPALTPLDAGVELDVIDERDLTGAEKFHDPREKDGESRAKLRSFSDSLITSDYYDD